MKTRSNSSFYLVLHGIILALVVLGFGLNAIQNSDSLPPSSSIIWIHGIAMFGWYLLIVIQSLLIQKHQFKIHRILGWGSLFLALGIIISGVWMTKEHYYRPNSLLFATINTFILINFSLLYSAAFLYRNKPEYHKRLISLASIAAMFPGLGRVILGLQWNEYLSVPLWILFAMVPAAYDWYRSKKIHPAPWIGGSMIIIGIGLTLFLMENKPWKNLMDSFLSNW